MIRSPISRLFRQVQISDRSKSRIYLHSLPGLNEPLETCREEMWRCGITRVICLAPFSDIEDYSWSYAQAIKKNAEPWKYVLFEIPDFGIPDDRSRYLTFVREIADIIRETAPSKNHGKGAAPPQVPQTFPDELTENKKTEHILIHCMAGVGRSGTFAVTLLLALGYPRDESVRRVQHIGSGPESKKQRDLIDWCEQELQAGRT